MAGSYLYGKVTCLCSFTKKAMSRVFLYQYREILQTTCFTEHARWLFWQYQDIGDWFFDIIDEIVI